MMPILRSSVCFLFSYCLLHVIGVNALALSRWQVVDAPPAHLEAGEAEEEEPEAEAVAGRCGAMQTCVDVHQIAEPGNGCPGLFRIPCPIGAPRFFGPECAEEHADGHEGEADVDEVVDHVEVSALSSFRGVLFGQHEDGNAGGCTKQRIAEHVNNDVRCEPGALQGWHQGGAVNLGLEEVDADKDQSHQGGEGEDPTIAPTAPGDEACHGHEERVPEACLAHGAKGWTFEADPHADDVGEEDEDAQGSHRKGLRFAVFD